MTSGDYFATRTTLPKSFMSSRRVRERRSVDKSPPPCMGAWVRAASARSRGKQETQCTIRRKLAHSFSLGVSFCVASMEERSGQVHAVEPVGRVCLMCMLLSRTIAGLIF
jgi:hypothetical protein